MFGIGLPEIIIMTFVLGPFIGVGVFLAIKAGQRKPRISPDFSSSNKFCPACGAQINMAIKCHSCGKIQI